MKTGLQERYLDLGGTILVTLYNKGLCDLYIFDTNHIVTITWNVGDMGNIRTEYKNLVGKYIGKHHFEERRRSCIIVIRQILRGRIMWMDLDQEIFQ
jgi:hypothetical protein